MPLTLGRAVIPVVAGSVGGDLEVLAELLISGLLPQGLDVLAELVPVQVERESIEEERLGDEVVEGQHADLFKDVRQQDVVVRLELFLQKAPESGSGRLGVKDGHDPEEGGGVLGRHAAKVRRGCHRHRATF